MRAVALASVLAIVMAKMTLGEETAIPEYTIIPLEWDVEVAPGQHAVLNGTMEEVFAQIIELNPDFQLDSSSSKVRRDAAARVDRRATTANCGTFPLANKARIQ